MSVMKRIRMKKPARASTTARTKKRSDAKWWTNRAGLAMAATGAAAIAILLIAAYPSGEQAATPSADVQAVKAADHAEATRLATPAPAPKAGKRATAAAATAAPAHPATEPSEPDDVESAAPITITGCLEQSDDAFRLKDTAGDDAPKSRSWKSGFLKKRAAPIEIVDAPDRLRLPSHVGERVSVTGTLVDRKMTVRSLQRVAPSCDKSKVSV